jgi:serine/threonine-protein kinase
MADVLLALGRGPSGFNKLVVLKTMRKELVADDELRQMFLAEARLSARLNHANVVQVYEVVDSAQPCIVMEYLEGQSMSTLLHEARDKFTLPMQLRVISEVLAGLHYSHELKDYDGTPLNIVHRDVSPQNVFLTYDGQIKILDFGIAKAANNAGQTRTGVIKGKITYMPREQLMSEEIDRRADIYAVGCMLWQAAAGEKLWANSQERDIMRALLDGTIPAPSTVRPVDPKLEAIIMKALAPDAKDRHDTAAELRKVIDQYLAEFYPSVSLRDVGTLISEVFTEQQEARARAIHTAITAPRSEPPPPMPEGLDPIISGVSTNSFVMERKAPIVWSIVGAVVTAVILLGGVVGFLAWRGRDSALTNASAQAAGSSRPTQVQVRLMASPAQAILTVDGNPVSGNPATLTVPHDQADHEIRATLSGYEPALRTVKFDRDLSLEILLNALPAPAASVEPSPKAPKGPSPAVTRPRGGGAPKPAAGNCDPPFYFENGIKVYKPGCL